MNRKFRVDRQIMISKLAEGFTCFGRTSVHYIIKGNLGYQKLYAWVSELLTQNKICLAFIMKSIYPGHFNLAKDSMQGFGIG